MISFWMIGLWMVVGFLFIRGLIQMNKAKKLTTSESQLERLKKLKHSDILYIAWLLVVIGIVINGVSIWYFLLSAKYVDNIYFTLLSIVLVIYSVYNFFCGMKNYFNAVEYLTTPPNSKVTIFTVLKAVHLLCFGAYVLTIGIK